MYQEILRVFVALGAPFELEAWGKVLPSVVLPITQILIGRKLMEDD
jgi:hypothetical protein